MPGFATAINGLPGFRAAVSTGFRNVFKQEGKSYLALNGVIDGTKSRDPLNTDDIDRLRPGLLMGKITSGGKWANSVLGVTTGTTDQTGTAYTSGGTSIAVAPAVATEIVRRIGATGTLKYVGPPSAAGTVATLSIAYSAVNTTTGVITTTSLGANLVIGSLVCPTDGSEIILTLIDDGNLIPVTDSAGVSQDQPFSQIPIAGVIDSSQIINWPADASTRTYVKQALSTLVGGKFIFDDVYGA